MKITKSRLRKIIKEELLKEDVRQLVFSRVKESIYRLDEALLNIKSNYGKTAEYKELEKAGNLVKKWYKKWI